MQPANVAGNGGVCEGVVHGVLAYAVVPPRRALWGAGWMTMTSRKPIHRLAWAVYHVVIEHRSWRVGRPLFSEGRGGGGPTIVFLHGLTASRRSWYRVADDLRGTGLQLRLVDLLGFGRSPWPYVAYTADDHLAALEDWRTVALPDVPIVLVGHSLGAMLSLAWAVRCPAVVGAVLIGLPVYPDQDAGRCRLARLSLLNRLTLTARPLGWAACMLMCAMRPLCRLMAPLFLRALPVPVARDGALHTWRSLSGTLDHCIFGPTHPQRVAPPLLFVHGNEDDVAPIEGVRALAARLPRARLVEVPGGGHDLLLSHPGALADLIRLCVPEIRADAGVPGAAEAGGDTRWAEGDRLPS